jgi:hypothetical protein
MSERSPSQDTLTGLSPEDPRVQAYYAENPERAEADQRARQAAIARSQRQQREHLTDYARRKREGARRAGTPVVPMALLKERARNPRTVLVGRPDRLRLVPVQVLAAKVTSAPTNAPRRTNGTSGRPRAQATRSSAASGDSPEDAGDSEPPAANRWRWAQSAWGRSA